MTIRTLLPRMVMVLGCGLFGLAIVVTSQLLLANPLAPQSSVPPGADAIPPLSAPDTPSEAGDAAGTPKGDQNIQITNGLIAVEIDETTGHLIGIEDLTKNPALPLIDGRLHNFKAVPPFLVTGMNGAGNICQPEGPPEVTICADSDDECRRLRWHCGNSIFDGRIELPAGQAKVRFSGTFQSGDNAHIMSITYPIIGPLSPLSDNPDADTMAIPYEGGMLIRNPIQRAREEAGSSIQVLRDMKYPFGHSAMLQMISYQSAGVGGFLVHTPDSQYTVKRFSVQDLAPLAPNPWVMLSVEHKNWDVENIDHKGGMALDYPVEITALTTGDWHEAADIYRKWGEQQVWAARPIAERADQERALFEHATASVFGLSAREDQTAWYRGFHDLLCDGLPEARVLFVPGWDFHPNGEADGQPISAFYQAGWEERFWLPYQGAFVDNYQVMKTEHDDFVYPFLFDMLIHDQYPGWAGFNGPARSEEEAATWNDLQVFDAEGQPGGYYFQMPTFEGYTHTLNPANATVREFHRWRNELLNKSVQDGVTIRLDGTYHDISTTLIALENYGENSDVPYKGAGRWMVQAIRDMYDNSLSLEANRTSMGIENASEPFIDQIDFYHLGAEGLGPIRPRAPESAPDQATFNGLHQWVMDGNAVNIPLVSFVYHAYGALRTGGKIQASYDMGDAFYWITASEYLWGGILELIYFNTPADLLPNIDPDQVDCEGGYPCAFMTAWSSADISPRGWYYDGLREADPAKLDFLRKAARLRLEQAPEYLVSGRMLTPPRLDQTNPNYEYDYNFYSSILGENYNHYGSYTAPAVLAEAWESFDHSKKAIILANPTGETQEATLTFDPATYGLDRVAPRLNNAQNPSHSSSYYPVCVAGEDCILYVPLAPRSFYVLNLSK